MGGRGDQVVVVWAVEDETTVVVFVRMVPRPARSLYYFNRAFVQQSLEHPAEA